MENRVIKILAIDDNQDNLISLKALINESFPDVITLTALTGKRGLELAASENPDVILLDIVMPVMDGFEVCKRLKANKQFSDIPVVFVTALKGDKESRIRALEAGAEAFIAKPVDEIELTAQIRAMVKIRNANILKAEEKERLAKLVEQQTQELRKTHLATLNLLEDLKRENEARKISEAILSDERKLMRTIIDLIPDAIYVKDIHGRKILANPKEVQLSGKNSEDEIIGKTDFDLYPELETQKFYEEDQILLHSGKPTFDIESKITNINGDIRYLLGSKVPLRDSHGKITGIVGLNHDITERKHAERILQDIITKNPMSIQIVDKNGFTLNVNAAHTNLFGAVPPSDYSIFDDLQLKQQGFGELLESVKNGNVVHFPDLHFNVHDLSSEFSDVPIWIRMVVFPLHDSSGNPERFILMHENITDRKRAEEEKEHKWKQLARQQEILAEIATSSYTIDGDLENMTTLLTERVAKYMEVERVSVWLFDEVENELHCINLYELSKNLHTSGAKLKESEFKNEFEALRNSKYVDVNDTLTDPRVAGYVESYIKPCKITAMLDGVIRYSNSDFGTLCVEHVQKAHVWSTDEINFVCQLADQIALTLSNHERKAAETELRKLSSSVEQSPVSIVITNINGTIEYVNPKFTAITGYGFEEAINQNPKLLKSGKQAQEFYESLWNTILSGKIWQGELHNKKKNGEYYWENAIISPIFDEKRIITHFVAVKEDITERKRSQNEITLLANALKGVNECVSITDMDDILIFVNQSFSKTYGYSEDELIGKKMMVIRSPNNSQDLIDQILPATLQGGWKGELINARKDGTEFSIALSTTIIRDLDGKPIAFIGVASDITERKKQERELIESKELAELSNKLKDAFIANMSHEIRTPLNGILGMTSIIQDIYSDYIQEGEEKYFTAVEKSCQRIVRTVDMILNYSRLQVGAFTVKQDEIEIASICENLIQEFKPAANKQSLELTFENKIGKAFFDADKYSITQAIANLIDNAIKYTKEGFVKIELCHGVNDDIVLSVIDSGIGISEKYLSRIFEPYSQEHIGYGRAYEGVGLGLALVKKILDLNDALISVESRKGEGTIFSINFGIGKQSPHKESPPVPVKIPKADTKESKKDLVILMVEDDQINLDLLKMYVEGSYKFITTDSSDDVVEILKNNDICLILMDISINGSKNGLELTTEIKSMSKFAHIPIVAVTAHAFARDRENALSAGCDEYLSKPFNKTTLLDKIGMLLN